MYAFLLKYKQVLLNAFILICLIFVAGNYGRDFFLGAASGAVLIMLGESIANVRSINKNNQQETFQ